MDFNRYFSEIWMHLGYYDTKTIRIKWQKLAINRILIAILLICMIKLLIINLDYSSGNRLRFYLIGLLYVEGKGERLFEIGVFLLHGAVLIAIIIGQIWIKI